MPRMGLLPDVAGHDFVEEEQPLLWRQRGWSVDVDEWLHAAAFDAAAGTQSVAVDAADVVVLVADDTGNSLLRHRSRSWYQL